MDTLEACDVLSLVRPPHDERPCLLRFNGDFEYELANGAGRYTPSPFLLEMNRQLSPVMRLLGGTKDRVLDLDRLELEPGSFRYVPWGVTPTTLQEAARLEPGARFPDIDAVGRVQDRRFSLSLEHALHISLPGSQVVTSLEALDEAVAAARGPYVLKHPFGVAGRERAFGRPGAFAEGARRWCAQALASIGALVLEPWVERVRDLGVQWWLPEKGEPRLLGILELLTDPNGAYRGHRLGELVVPAGLVETNLEVARRVQAEGYFGPLGIDAFEFRNPDASIGLRPVVELNARFTMGMCALGLRRYVPRGHVGEWVHHDARGGIPPAVEQSLRADPYDPDRCSGTLLISPRMVGGQPARRLSVLRVRQADCSSPHSQARCAPGGKGG